MYLTSRNSAFKNMCCERGTNEPMDDTVNIRERIWSAANSFMIDQTDARERGQKEREREKDRFHNFRGRRPLAASSNADISSGRSANIAASFT